MNRSIGSEFEDRDRFRKEVAVGIKQLEQGDFEEYDDESLSDLFEAIKRAQRT